VFSTGTERALIATMLSTIIVRSVLGTAAGPG